MRVYKKKSFPSIKIFDNGDTAMREKVLEKFKVMIEQQPLEIRKIAVIGGRLVEPELEVLNLDSNVVINSFGIDKNSQHYLDLNKKLITSKFENIHDLVICSQVIEHVWDVKQALINLLLITRPGGIIWLNCPASNRAHFAPDYYSAGYTPNLIINLFRIINNNIILESGVIGSKRYYFMNHALSIWATPEEHKNPVLGYAFSRLPGPFWRDFLRFIRDIPGRVYAATKSSVISSDIKWGCETWVMVRKK